MIRPDSTGEAIVDTSHPYYPMNSCPVARKVILRGGGGVAVIGEWNGKDPFWTHWAPLPVLKNIPRGDK